jgi:hypothetical protein
MFRMARGWSASYPETTGYLIPTFIELANEPGLAYFEQRAERAIEFLIGCQLQSGAFPGGEINQNTTVPSVFNTAQVVCGLLAWHAHTGEQRAIDAAVRAGNWLVSVQDADGAWRNFAYRDLATAYTAYASCWVASLGQSTGDPRFTTAASKHLMWVLSLVDPITGWFDAAGFTSQQHAARIAVTHTIAYTLWGVLMTSELLGVHDGVTSVQRASARVAERFLALRWLPGILDSDWNGRARFACVTGTAQMALIWMRLATGGGDASLLATAISAIETVKHAQHMRAWDPGLRGAIPGSDPVWGAYMRFAYPNWAAKFFVDALFEKRRAVATTITKPITRAPPNETY